MESYIPGAVISDRIVGECHYQRVNSGNVGCLSLIVLCSVTLHFQSITIVLHLRDMLSSNDKVALADAVLPWYWCLGFSCKVDEYCWSTLAHCAR